MILFFCSVCVINPPWRDISIGLVIKTWKNTSHHLSSFNATWKSVLANLYLWLMFCYLPLPLELLLATQKYKWASWISIPRQIEINVSEKPAEPEEICRDGPWPDPTRAYFWPAVNKRPTRVLFDPTQSNFFWPEG